MLLRLISIVPLLCGALVACGERADEPLRVDAAASLREIVGELALLHAERTGRPEPLVNLAGSGELARQIEAARKTDVFLSAGERELDRLDEGGLLVNGSRRLLCTNSLVVVAREERADFVPDRLADASFVAVGHTELVPAGRYAAEWLREVGLLDRLSGQLTHSANVRAALAAVQSGAAEYGIVYASDVASAPDLTVVHCVPEAEAPPIRYPGAVLTCAVHVEEAHAFLELCTSSEGRAIFERHGFGIADRN